MTIIQRISYLFSIIFLLSHSSNAQQDTFSYPNTDKLQFKSEYLYIYKVPTDSIVDYVYKNKKPSPYSPWLQKANYTISPQQFDSVLQQAPIGHYLVISINAGSMKMFYHKNTNLITQFVSFDKEKLLIIKDKSGKERNDVQVKYGKQTIPYNNNIKAYSLSNTRQDTLSIIDGDDVQLIFSQIYKNYNSYNNNYYDSYNRTNYTYDGYLVTNKPVYKPGDTVRYKAHLLNPQTKKPIEDSFEVLIRYAQTYSMQTISPYAPGVYFNEFVLGDSIQPDKQYMIELRSLKTNLRMINYFKVEDYLLEDLRLKVSKENNTTYQYGDSIDINAFAHNANGLPINDGTFDIWVLNSNFFPNKNTKAIYVPDTLYHTRVSSNPEGENIIKIPTNQFPKEGSMSVCIKVQLQNAEFQKKDTLIYISYIGNNRNLKIEEKDGKIYADLIENKKSVNGNGFMKINGNDSIAIQYPFEANIEKNNYQYSFLYTNKGENNFKTEVYQVKVITPIVTNTYKGDTVTFKLSQIKNKTLRYFVYIGNTFYQSGFTTNDTSIIIKTKDDATVTMLYCFEQNNNFNAQKNIAYKFKSNINIDIHKKDIIYPGQVDEISIKLSDEKNKAISNTNLTVLAFNATFKEDFVPKLSAAGFIAPGIEADTFKQNFINIASPIHHNEPLSYKWAQITKMDTAFFYKNIYFNKAAYTSYRVKTERKDIAQIAVYIKKNNTYMTPEYIFYDNTPLYTLRATIGPDPNAIFIHPSMNRLNLRSQTHSFFINNLKFNKGEKTIIFINADSLAFAKNKNAKMDKVPDTLMQWEKDIILNATLQVKKTRNEGYAIQQYNIDFLSNNFSYPHLDNQYYFREAEYDYYNPDNNVSYIVPIINGENIQYFQSNNVKMDIIPERDYIYDINPGILRLEKNRPFVFLSSVIQIANNPINFKKEISLPLDFDTLNVVFKPVKESGRHWKELVIKNDGYSIAKDIPGKLSIFNDQKLDAPKLIIISHEAKSKPMVIDYYLNFPFSVNLNPGVYDIYIVNKNYLYSTNKDVSITPYGINNIWANELKPQIPKAIQHLLSIKYTGSKSIAKHNKQYYPDTRQFDIYGIVENTKGQKIKHAKVSLGIDENRTAPRSTDAHGVFSIQGIYNYYQELLVTADGYKDQKIIINSNELDGYGIDFKIVMEPKESTLSEIIIDHTSQILNSFVDEQSQKLYQYGSKEELQTVSVFGQKVDRRKYTGSLGTVTADEISRMPATFNSESYSNAAPPMRDVSIRGQASVSSSEVNAIKENNILNTAEGKNFVAEFLNDMQSASGMRSNFRDWAIWEPNLWTDKNGQTSFKVQYPDNATSWKTYVLAMNKEGITASAFELTSAFKPLSASLSMPSFLRYGDSVEVIGKVLNHTGTSFKLNTTFKSLNIDVESDWTDITTGKIEKQWIAAPQANKVEESELTTSFKLDTENNYEDGELKTIPIYPVGVKENKGFFTSIFNDTIIKTKASDIAMPFSGNVYINIEGNLLEVMLSEIEKLKVYPHGCTEQLTSKLLAIFYEERVKTILGNDSFNNVHEKQQILSKIIAAQNRDGSFGWFGGNSVDYRITNYVLSTMQKANENAFSPILYKGLSFLNFNLDRMPTPDLINALSTLSTAKFSSNYATYIAKAESNKLSVYERLALLKIKKERNLPYRSDLDEIMKEAVEDKNGLRWGEHSYDWYRNDVAATLLAYEIIKDDSIYKNKKEGIMQFLLSKRNNGYYSNTAESGLILTTLLPDLSKTVNINPHDRKKTMVIISGSKNDTITNFPARIKVSDKDAAFQFQKQGISPVYLSVAYEYFNPIPKPISNAFEVQTKFLNKSDQTVFEQGETIKLQVSVNSKSDAEYVMIEVPIPAGCVVMNKNSTNYKESSRANFKDKTVIYCGRLAKGTHHFEIEMQARYKGSFTINPASATLMYFADENGNNELKKMKIK